jgi:hypothetical protein
MLRSSRATPTTQKLKPMRRQSADGKREGSLRTQRQAVVPGPRDIYSHS